jgi:hypothetical protein
MININSPFTLDGLNVDSKGLRRRFEELNSGSLVASDTLVEIETAIG